MESVLKIKQCFVYLVNWQARLAVRSRLQSNPSYGILDRIRITPLVPHNVSRLTRVGPMIPKRIGADPDLQKGWRHRQPKNRLSASRNILND